MQASQQLALRNRILRALPQGELDRIWPHLKNARLEKDELVYLTGDDIQYVYLPESGLLSLMCTTQTGSTIECALVGNEGVVGFPIVLKNRAIPYDVMVRFATNAIKIKAEAFQEEFDRGETLHDSVLGYLNVLLTQVSQSSICNRFHSVEETLSRWLLIVHDRVNADRLNLTQQVIAEALGVPRSGVTVAAGALQRDGAIRYRRGKIVILDRATLETKSCECYRILRDALH